MELRLLTLCVSKELCLKCQENMQKEMAKFSNICAEKNESFKTQLDACISENICDFTKNVCSSFFFIFAFSMQILFSLQMLSSYKQEIFNV